MSLAYGNPLGSRHKIEQQIGLFKIGIVDPSSSLLDYLIKQSRRNFGCSTIDVVLRVVFRNIG